MNSYIRQGGSPRRTVSNRGRLVGGLLGGDCGGSVPNIGWAGLGEPLKVGPQVGLGVIAPVLLIGITGNIEGDFAEGNEAAEGLRAVLDDSSTDTAQEVQ